MRPTVLFCDMDGTILHHPGEYMHKEDEEAIHHFHAAGNSVVFSTGRMESMVWATMEKLQFPEDNPLITQNGGVLRLSDRQECFTFTPQLLRSIFDFLNSFPDDDMVTIGVTTPENVFLPETYKEAGWSHVDVLPDFQNALHEHPIVRIFINAPAEKLLAMQAPLQRLFGSEVNVPFTSSQSMDVLPLQSSKGYAMDRCLASGLYKGYRVAAIGDSENDVSMFERTAYSFAMSSGLPHVQEVARHVVSSVSEALRWLENNA